MINNRILKKLGAYEEDVLLFNECFNKSTDVETVLTKYEELEEYCSAHWIYENFDCSKTSWYLLGNHLFSKRQDGQFISPLVKLLET